jgi:putative ABC transport system permease protein
MDVTYLGIMNRAFRNISRRKIRALLVIVALGFSLAILISIPPGITASQTATQALTQNLGNTIVQTEASINQTMTQIDCSLTPSFAGFGFRGNFTPGEFGAGGGRDFNFTPGQFGGGSGAPGEFGGGAFGGGGSNPMNESLYSDINSIQGVAAVAPILQVSEGENVTQEMFGRSFTRMVPQYTIIGLPLEASLIDNYPVLPTNITAGRNLQAGDSGVVLLSENNSAFFGVGVGGTVDLLGQNFEVVGIHGTSGVSDNIALYMSLSDAQTLTNNTGYITSLRVFADNSADVTNVANAVSALHADLDVTTAQQRLDQLNQMQASNTQLLQNAQNTMNQTQTMAFEEILVVVAATSLIVLFVMLYTVRERTKEIGTLKAIGFSNWNVMSQFMLEGVLLSMLAGVVGIAIGAVAAPFLSSVLLPTVNPFGSTGSFRIAIQGATAPTQATIALDPQIMLIAFGASVLLGALGSLYPAWRASRTRPAEAMRYE